jgi:23S rRNA maturation mini-RNase III
MGRGRITLNLNAVNINYIGGDVLQVMFKMFFLFKTFSHQHEL